MVPGMNGGWIQSPGPSAGSSDFKLIETTLFGSAIQQVRYPPTRVAYTPALALSRLFMLPGATYVDPEFSWKYEIGPAGTTFVKGNALGAEYNGTLWIGSARIPAGRHNGGSLYRLKLTPTGSTSTSAPTRGLPTASPTTSSAPTKFEGTESETLRIGRASA